MPDPVKVAQGRYAYYHRRGGDPRLRDEAFRELSEVKLERHIREVLAAAPPLSQEQLDRLASLLRAGGEE